MGPCPTSELPCLATLLSLLAIAVASLGAPVVGLVICGITLAMLLSDVIRAYRSR